MPKPIPLLSSTRRQWLIAAMAWPWLAHAQLAPVMVEGQPFERRVAVAGTPLRLNGTGVRAVAWFKGYAAGLYLTERATTAAKAVAMPGPKRLQMRMLQEVPAAEFLKAFDKGVVRNSSPAEVEHLAGRMASFGALITQTGQVRPGDVVDLDFDPRRGTLYIFNGTQRGEPIPGEDFYAALLRAFVGDQPYDKKLKAGLLAGA